MGNHHDNNHSTEKKPVAFVVPFALAIVTLVAILSLVSLGNPCHCKEQCTEAFKFNSEELKFYTRMKLPLPRLCPNCRHYERLAQRNPLKLWHRQCMCDKNHAHHTGKCTNEFETSYAPDRPEIVYCEQCYNAEVA